MSEPDLSAFPDIVFNAVVYGMGYTNESWAAQLHDRHLGPSVAAIVAGLCTALKLSLEHGDTEGLTVVAEFLDNHRLGRVAKRDLLAEMSRFSARLTERPGGLVRK